MSIAIRPTWFAPVLAVVALGLIGCEDAAGPEPEAATPAGGVTEVAATGHAAAAPEQAEVGEPAPNFTLPGSDGEQYRLEDHRGKWVILEWINHDCPFVKKFYGAGKMQQLQEKYTEAGAVWLSICSSAPGKQGHEPAERWNELTAEKNASPTAILIDEDGTVGRKYRATNTPHMYVIDPEGTLVYMGAIDSDRSANPAAIADADNYVTMVMDAVLIGEQPPVQHTDAYGCAVHYP